MTSPPPPPLPPTRTSHKLYLILSLLPSTIPPSRSLPSPHNPRQFYITGRQILCCQHSSRLPGIPPPPPLHLLPLLLHHHHYPYNHIPLINNIKVYSHHSLIPIFLIIRLSWLHQTAYTRTRHCLP